MGWLKRGPSGIIGTNIGDAHETTESVLQDARAGRLPTRGPAGAPGSGAIGALAAPSVVTWPAYKAIEAAEEAAGAAVGKPREKLVRVDAMLRAAGKT